MSRRSTFILAGIILIAIAAGYFVTSKDQASDAPPMTALVGQTAPDFSLPLVGGGEVRLSDLRGRIVLVNFWATWCPPCKAEMPSMERLYAQFQDRDFELLAVNAEVDGLEVLPDFLQKHPYTFPIPVDTEGDVQVKYGVFRFPESFIIGRDGKVVEHIIGARDWSDNQTIQLIDSLTKG